MPTDLQTTAEQTVLNFFHALTGGNAESALAMLDPNGFIDIVPAGIRGNLRHEGSGFFTELLAAFPDLEIAINTTFSSSSGSVVAEIKMQGTQASDFLGVTNQEKHIDLDGGWIFHVEDGVITSITAYWCQNQLYRRLAVKRLDQIALV